ncbi:LysR substrate-binding domain-containing protein [Pandoraea pulmonicola]|uniref:HTH-type transcriptional activator CmpR n=1 Tax=Pandoraea pulmonicola TaxID=93221 RepID=A0AAJ5D3U3_PANPU|nr:LysR substrate-binding domain-containing protein [Pandoraea pulmonicola]AJC22398.1 LysR family transcriptional regulator [Pandoraea pulmonicola]SUD95664.1 HTH-type transcriptional activator CmpR [Pandoraea pulmonicola]
MDMRDIQVFRAVMRAGTTSKAAALLNVSQPAVSQSIRKLEASSELRLFERTRGRLVPTQEALALIEEVDRCFAGFEMIEHRIRSLRSFGLGRLAVASFPALGTGFMPRAIAAFGLEARRVQMSFQIMSSREVHQQVSAGQLDFGLMADELSVSGLEHSQFMSVPGVIVMNDSHPLANKPTISAEDLLAHPFIALNPEDATRRRLEQSLMLEGKILRPILETPYSNSVCEFALRGVGMGMAHPILALDYVTRGLKLKPMENAVNFTALLVFRPGIPLSENAKELLRVMRIQMESDMNAMRQILEGV